MRIVKGAVQARGRTIVAMTTTPIHLLAQHPLVGEASRV
jgi:hypothetical protein